MNTILYSKCISTTPNFNQNLSKFRNNCKIWSALRNFDIKKLEISFILINLDFSNGLLNKAKSKIKYSQKQFIYHT